DAVYYALRKHDIARRSASENSRIRFDAKPLSYRIKNRQTPKEERLKLAAVMLYWAEGYKAGTHTVDFANSDPEIALIFRRFLSEICRVDETRVRGHIYCYEGQDPAMLTTYWSKLLQIPKEQFIKPYIKKAAAPGPRGPRMTNGLVHICYSDKKLLAQILAWIGEYRQDLTNKRVGGGVVNRNRL
ncbi:MAG: hypothetical protein KGI78_01535, partial [Patescibacteria group bacterium]|nr:hypothetical protein [Patescibacteria group bacterium]